MVFYIQIYKFYSFLKYDRNFYKMPLKEVDLDLVLVIFKSNTRLGSRHSAEKQIIRKPQVGLVLKIYY